MADFALLTGVQAQELVLHSVRESLGLDLVVHRVAPHPGNNVVCTKSLMCLWESQLRWEDNGAGSIVVNAHGHAVVHCNY